MGNTWLFNPNSFKSEKEKSLFDWIKTVNCD